LLFMSEFSKRLQEIIKTVFPKFEGQIDDCMTSDQVEGWDSMGHLNLIMRVQEEFSVVLDFSEIMAIETIGDILQILEEKDQK